MRLSCLKKETIDLCQKVSDLNEAMIKTQRMVNMDVKGSSH